MSREYTHDEMLSQLTLYFAEKYEFNETNISRYPKDLGPIRVPLYCVKKEDERIVNEVVIDIITSFSITKEQIFPEIDTDGIIIMEASPVVFYQYYFPKAKIFLAYPDYINKNNEFNGIKSICSRIGVGLLEVSRKGTREVVKSNTLVTLFCNDIDNRKKKSKTVKEIIENYLENYVIRLVYYPEPIYKRRAIIGRIQGQISYVLIDKLQELKNINVSYRETLKQLYTDYRQETLDDCEIAFKCIDHLWKTRLGIEFPEIQRHLEEILLRDKMYREHFVHQFQVFLIGTLILDKLYKKKEFKDTINSFGTINKCKIEDAWLAASTYHDFNYGLQNFENWLLRFFHDTLSINNEEAKENLVLLNLDSAMVRESFVEILANLVKPLKLNDDSSSKAIKFFYEKSVRDKNHGLLSALSFLKLCEIGKDKLKVNINGLTQAAFAIACHDEDIWESLCGCKGYLRSNAKCDNSCDRKLWENKEAKIHKRNFSSERKNKCEIWEEEFMSKSVMKKIEFDKSPLLFLLIICDSVQDEGRINNNFSNFSGTRDEKKIALKNILITKWVESNKKLEEFEQSENIRTAFSSASYNLSNEARIYKYKLSDGKWKVVDKNIFYIIENKIGKGYYIHDRRKECLLNDVNFDTGISEVRIDLSIDGIDLKLKELERLSWALKDDRFSIHLEEKDTEVIKEITINGSGGE